jgi:hypothetical protein
MKRNYFPQVNDFSDQYSGGQGLWEGSGLAGQSDATLQGQQGMLAQLPGLQQQLNMNAGTLEGFLDYDPNSPINQARRNAFSAQAMNNFNTNLRPAIEDRGSFAGQFGGPQALGAIGNAGASTMRDINSFEANMMDQDRTRAFNAMQMAPSIFASQMMPNQIQQQVGGMQDARSQAELMDQIMQFEQPRNNSLRSLQDIGNLYQPFSGLGSGGNVGGSNPIQSALGGAFLGSQLYSGGNPFAGMFGGPDVTDLSKSSTEYMGDIGVGGDWSGMNW